MNNGNAPVNSMQFYDESNNTVTVSGITMREHFAGLVMQGIASNSAYNPTEPVHFEAVAVDALAQADALLKELTKQRARGE